VAMAWVASATDDASQLTDSGADPPMTEVWV
jgi:hypothetical protein